MSILDSIFGGGSSNSPMNAANQYLNQIPGVAHEGYDPYVNSGMDASNRTKSIYEQLIQDPTGFINKLTEGYKPSEGYQFQKEQLTKELSNNAAQGGIAGTPYAQQTQGEMVQKLLSGDMQQFLKNVLGIFDTGLSGEEGVAQRGYDASGKLTDALSTGLGSQAGLSFMDQQQKNSNRNDMWHVFGKALGAGAGAYLGGIPGAKVGAALA